MSMNRIILSVIVLLITPVLSFAAANETQFIEPGTGCNFMKDLPSFITKPINDLKAIGVIFIAFAYVFFMLSQFGSYMKEKGEEGDAVKKKSHLTNMFTITLVLIVVIAVIQFGLSYFSWYGTC